VVVFENDTPESYSSTDNMDGTFFVDNTKPSVELISSSYSGGRIYFTMNSSDANFDNVTVFLHSISGLIKTYSNNSSSFSNSFSVGSGTYYLNATSYDLAGNFENTETVNYFISESSSSSSSSGGSSGSYYYLENLPKEGRNFRLYSGQKVRFVVKNETHFLEVISLKNNSAKIVVYSDFFEKNMAIGNSWKIDIDDDLIYDFKVNLNSIWKGIYANITVLPFIENIFLEEDLKKIMGGLNKTSLASSNDLKFFINLDDSVNFPFPLNLTFEIFDMNKQILYGGEEIISKASKKNYMFPDLNLQSGEYIFFANLSYKNYVLKTFEENFIVGPIKSLITGEVVGGEREYFSWILWGIGFFVFFVFVFMFFRKRRKMKKHKRKRKSLEQIKSLNFDQFIRELNKI